MSLWEAQGEHRETGSREFSVRKITCDQVPLLVQIERQSVWTVFKFPSLRAFVPPILQFGRGWQACLTGWSYLVLVESGTPLTHPSVGATFQSPVHTHHFVVPPRLLPRRIKKRGIGILSSLGGALSPSYIYLGGGWSLLYLYGSGRRWIGVNPICDGG